MAAPPADGIGLGELAGVVDELAGRGAGDIAHPGGDLLAHVVRTAAALRSWGAPAPLVAAGLAHAAYGTDGFAPSLFRLDERPAVVALVGAEAEALVYAYGSADRSVVHPRLSSSARPVRHRDRFTGAETELDDGTVRAFAELTVANELDLVRVSPDVAAEHGADLATLFARWRPHLSPTAWSAVVTAFPSVAPD